MLPRIRLVAAILSGALWLAPALHADERPSAPDTIRRDAWRLANGLRVVTVHVPAAKSVAITVVYPGGRDQDPPGREGLSLLLGELQFTAAAGEVPERTRDDLASQRPLGYDVIVARRHTTFTEIASPAQFPGVLHQVAARMRGVKATPTGLAEATRTVSRMLHGFYFGDVAQGLYYEVRELAGGADSATIGRLGSGRGITPLTLQDVAPSLAGAFAPSSAVLCVAGNLAGLKLRAVIENELSSVPVAPSAPAPPGLLFHPGAGVEPRGDIAAPVGVIGVLAPALEDTLHPSFYLSLLVLGSQAKEYWGDPEPPLRSRFQYSLFDDPDLARFYPLVTPEVTDASLMAAEFADGLGRFGASEIASEALETLRLAVGWILGGPVSTAMQNRLVTDRAALATLASSTATRELWGGEPFWSVYRKRFYGLDGKAHIYWATRIARAERQVRLFYRPDGR